MSQVTNDVRSVIKEITESQINLETHQNIIDDVVSRAKRDNQKYNEELNKISDNDNDNDNVHVNDSDVNISTNDEEEEEGDDDEDKDKRILDKYQ